MHSPCYTPRHTLTAGGASWSPSPDNTGSPLLLNCLSLHFSTLTTMRAHCLPRALPRSTLSHSINLQSRRHASSTQSAPRRFLSTTLVLGGSIALVACYYDSRSALHEHVVMPTMRLFDPELGHKLAVKMLSLPSWARPHDGGKDSSRLKAEVS